MFEFLLSIMSLVIMFIPLIAFSLIAFTVILFFDYIFNRISAKKKGQEPSHKKKTELIVVTVLSCLAVMLAVVLNMLGFTPMRGM